MMATRQPMRMAVGLPSALATGCWPRGSSSDKGEWSAPQQESCRTRGGGRGGTAPEDCSPKLLKLVGGGPGGHQGAGGKESEESFITSGEKEAKRRASQSRGPQGMQVRETRLASWYSSMEGPWLRGSGELREGPRGSAGLEKKLFLNKAEQEPVILSQMDQE